MPEPYYNSDISLSLLQRWALVLFAVISIVCADVSHLAAALPPTASEKPLITSTTAPRCPNGRPWPHCDLPPPKPERETSICGIGLYSLCGR